MPSRDYPAPDQERRPGPDRTPPPPSMPDYRGGPMPGPYYMPPYYPLPPLADKPPMAEVDRLLPTVPFMKRPRAYKAAIWFLTSGIIIVLIFLFFTLRFFYFTPLFQITLSLFIIIALLGFLSIFFLIIPKKIGWYFALITSILGLAGLPFGTPLAMLAIVSLMWPSTRYYFHTGQYPAQTHTLTHPQTHTPENYPQQYPPPYPHQYPHQGPHQEPGGKPYPQQYKERKPKTKTRERVYR